MSKNANAMNLNLFRIFSNPYNVTTESEIRCFQLVCGSLYLLRILTHFVFSLIFSHTSICLGMESMYTMGCLFILAVIRKDFQGKRLCPICKILNETAFALGHSLYMKMSPSSKNVMGHSLHQAFSYETFEF